MTKRLFTPTDAVLVAIDMSKHRQEVLIERPEGGRRRRLTVMATKPDYDRLAEDLAAIGRPILIGFEATGNYHRTLAYRLLTAGFELRLVSSVALARTRAALHNGWDKNDPKDAQVILHMLRIGATQLYVDPLAAGINDLQELSKTHETLPSRSAVGLSGILWLSRRNCWTSCLPGVIRMRCFPGTGCSTI